MINPAFAQIFGRDDNASHANAPLRAEALLLEAYTARYAAPAETFAPGDVIWHKVPHMSPYRGARLPMIFVGYLDDPIDGTDLASKPNQLSLMSAAKRANCRIGCLCTGSHYHEHLMDSRELTATRPAAAEASTETADATDATEPAPTDATPAEDDADAPPSPSPWREPAVAEVTP